MSKEYVEILMKLKAEVDAQLLLLRPYDADSRYRNKVVESLEQVLFDINWEILNSVKGRN